MAAGPSTVFKSSLAEALVLAACMAAAHQACQFCAYCIGANKLTQEPLHRRDDLADVLRASQIGDRQMVCMQYRAAWLLSVRACE